MVPKHTASVSELLPQSCGESVGDRKAAAENANASKISTTLWITFNWKRAVEIVIMSSVLLLVWSVFAIPTIIYALPPVRVR